MRVAALIVHLQKLDPEAEILPVWESHCPGDFGGLFRGASDDRQRERLDGRDLIFLECEERDPVVIWDVPAADADDNPPCGTKYPE